MYSQCRSLSPEEAFAARREVARRLREAEETARGIAQLCERASRTARLGKMARANAGHPTFPSNLEPAGGRTPGRLSNRNYNL
jgi:hypothetical protein